MPPENPAPVPTLAEVAAEAHVSRMTVSRVLRNSPHVLPETARRVHAAIAKVGYRPDAEVSRLMSYLSRHQARRGYRPIIAWIDTVGKPGESGAPLTMAAARDRAEELGYHLEEFWIGKTALSASRLSTILLTRNIQAVILPPVGDLEQSMDLPWRNFASVAIGFSLSAPALDRVDQNHYHAALLALGKLRSLGYQRIGIVDTTHSEIRLEHNYLAGFLVHQLAVPARRRVPPLLVEDLQRDNFITWLKRHRPDAVLGFDSQIPDWIRAAGHDIPKDVGYARLIVKPRQAELSGVMLNAAEIGRAAVELVVGKLHRNEFGLPREPRITLVEGVWNEGATTRRLATS